ncbi:MAG: branched-chain amino acid ABC transporter substrate-binding protein [Phycicoccus sp.]|nr:branched-chain amino acid ABC transporter substrate-binding protein [Phycicoccus sp.]NMM35651.1 branched-chain amino acid ABC transporter substrate-binding protein [Phycicoccus sp.]
MHQRSVVKVGASLMVAALALSACGSRSDSGTGTTSGNKIAIIGVMAPLSGDLSALGLGIQHSVELAVKQANANNAIPGWTLQVEAKDDEAKPDVGKNAATAFAAEPNVAGVVGDLNSSVSQSTQPVLATAKIVQVSPANTNPTLTQGADFKTAPKRTYDTYFRTCTTDAIQGPFAAQYMFKAGMTKVATIHDKKSYGQGLVEAFTAEFTKLGGTIVGAETINPDDSNYASVITRIKPKGPQGVYYGGEYPQAGPLSQQMKAAGLTVPLMGGDGIYDPKFIVLAGTTSDGDLATSVGAPTDQLAAGKKFLADYAAAGYKDPAAAYGAYSFDAANAIINALKVSLKDAKDVASVRQATIDAVGKVSFEGVTGQVAFDQYGDSTSRVLTVYKVVSGAWAPVSTEAFK